MSLFHAILNKHAPKKSRRVKQAVQPHWINSEILDAMQKHYKYQKENNIEQRNICRNKVKSLIKLAKTQFYSETINNNHKNPRQLRKNLHEITGKSKKSSSENLLYIPKPNCELYRNSFAYLWSKLWNSIPQECVSRRCL